MVRPCWLRRTLRSVLVRAGAWKVMLLGGVLVGLNYFFSFSFGVYCVVSVFFFKGEEQLTYVAIVMVGCV